MLGAGCSVRAMPSQPAASAAAATSAIAPASSRSIPLPAGLGVLKDEAHHVPPGDPSGTHRPLRVGGGHIEPGRSRRTDLRRPPCAAAECAPRSTVLGEHRAMPGRLERSSCDVNRTKQSTPSHCQVAAPMAASPISDAATAAVGAEGWCLVEGLFSTEEVAAAQAALPALFPTAEEFAADADPARNAPFRDDSHRVHAAVPLRGRLAQRPRRARPRSSIWPSMFGSSIADLRLYQAMLSAKYGGGAAERRAAAPRRLRQPHAGGAPPRTRLPATRDVRLPERRHTRDRGHPDGPRLA